MKKTLKIASLMLVLVMTVFIFASCGKTLSGTYKAESFVGSTTIEFTGINKYKSVTDALIGNNIVEEGTYEIDDEAGKITFTFERDGEEATRTSSFAQGEEDGVKYIKIDGIKYNKQ